jgi:hypothetical protein
MVEACRHSDDRGDFCDFCRWQELKAKFRA